MPLKIEANTENTYLILLNIFLNQRIGANVSLMNYLLYKCMYTRYRVSGVFMGEQEWQCLWATYFNWKC